MNLIKAMDTSLISIIIPTYNRAFDLERALQSVIAQTYTHWECIVVDNHSIDTTDEVVSRFNDPRIQLLKIHNQGVIAASRNLGIRHAKGEYIAFLDSDDRWVPSKLAVSLDYLMRGADIVYHDMWRIKKHNQRMMWRRVRCRQVSSPVFDDLIHHGNALVNSSVVIRSSFLKQLDGLVDDPELIAVEDFDCWLRLSRLTEQFVYIPQVLGFYWVGGGNVSRNPNLALTNLKKLQSIYFSKAMCDGLMHNPIWWEYSLARALYLLDENHLAKIRLQQLAKRRIGLSLRLKVSFMLLMHFKKHVI